MTHPTPAQLRELLERATPGPWEFWSVHRTTLTKPGEIQVHLGEEPSAFPAWRKPYVDESGCRVCTPVADAWVVVGKHPTSKHFAQAKANAALIVAAVNALPHYLSLISAAEEMAGALEPFAKLGMEDRRQIPAGQSHPIGMGDMYKAADALASFRALEGNTEKQDG
jgi:hypothetical protein